MHLKVRYLKREQIRQFSLCLGKALLSLSTNTEKSESCSKITEVTEVRKNYKTRR